MMKHGKRYLFFGLAVSVLLHLGFFQALHAMRSVPKKRSWQASRVVPVRIMKPEPKTEKPTDIIEKPKPRPKPKLPPKSPPKLKKKPPKKPKPKPQKKKEIVRIDKDTKPVEDAPPPLPVPNRTVSEPKDSDEATPVFGVTPMTVAKTGTGGPGIGVRVGNTLMMPQEEEYTPPEEVKPYAAVPVFALTSLPEYSSRVMPEYPESLRDDELEGEVHLSVTIDETGNVVDVEVRSSDHTLFSEAAVKAMKKCKFKPATQNGIPVATKIDIPVQFVLDM